MLGDEIAFPLPGLAPYLSEKNLEITYELSAR